MRTLLIDNYDSFTFNLFQLLSEVNGQSPIVLRNDHSLEALSDVHFDNVVISPGPGRPERAGDVGISPEFLRRSDLPVLGVCLGHQAFAHVHGARIDLAPEIMHGRLSLVSHNEHPLFEGIPQPFYATRYHSYAVMEPLPDGLERIAWSDDGIVMALAHAERPIWGVQFHPESICTEHGRRLLANFRDLSLAFSRTKGSPSRGSPTEPVSVVPVGTARTPPLADSGYDVHTRTLALFPDADEAFVRLYGNEPTAFWLDSSRAEPGLSRFSFMGDAKGPNGFVVRYELGARRLTIEKHGVAEHRSEGIFDYLRRQLEEDYVASPALPFDFNGGFVGYFGYELKAECGGKATHRAPHPDAQFVFADRMIVFDHLEKTTYLVCLTKRRPSADTQAEADIWFCATEQRLRDLTPLDRLDRLDTLGPLGSRGPAPDTKWPPFRMRHSRSDYLRDIGTCLDRIRNGETYEVCLTNQLKADAHIDPLLLYRNLRRHNPAPYSAFLRFGELAAVCSSPERFLRIDSEGRVDTKPIKGTERRGKTSEEDILLRERLGISEKDRAENLMIVDLVRNDLGLVCEVGSVEVPKLMDVETYSTVHQLVSTVRGKLRKDLRAIDCVRAAFPGGSMTGAPKLRTMMLIDALEGEARGIYSGSIGYLSLSGAADLNIVIRTAVVTQDSVSIGVGGAVIALSDPEAEFEETMLKAEPLVDATRRCGAAIQSQAPSLT